MRTMITLACTDCKRRNYTTKKNKQNNPDRVELKKYCKWCGHHTLHRETRQGFFDVFRQVLHTPVVQLVERRSPKPEVEGSSPSWRAIFSIKKVK